ncbi:Cation/H+ exchanger [Dillenia turbinata]|uniref:Cation/H+ exchanger n=1 Tax=Dillenia turbinata TaxID=194707 RepID=A0AAN8UM39_9MAGN
MVLYMFALGLEMDPRMLLQGTTREARVAYSSIFTTVLIGSVLSLVAKLSIIQSFQAVVGVSIFFAGTSSPLLTRLITNLKIGKSDIGELVIASGMQSDLTTTFLLAAGAVIFIPENHFRLRDWKNMIKLSIALIVQANFAHKVGPLFMSWVNHENPVGKPMKGAHLVLSIAFMVVVCFCSVAADYNKCLSAFITGVFLPRHGRLSRFMLSKVNYFISNIIYPMYFFWLGSVSVMANFGFKSGATWIRLFSLIFIVIVGKVTGALASGAMLGFHWKDSIAIGLFLAIKGQFHTFLGVAGVHFNVLELPMSLIITFVTLLTIVYLPWVGQYIINRARKRTPNKRMALQWLDPLTELRVLLCVCGPENVPSAISFMEISRGMADPGILVYLTDMVELTDKIAVTVRQGEGTDSVTVIDKQVMAMREQITASVNSYLANSDEGITVRRMLVLSTLTNMHQDISILAEDLLISLIILPFHKRRRRDGKLDDSQLGFRQVNRKVLRNAPCSVGILVDRGLGLSQGGSRSDMFLNVGVIFIGGKDDREALAYAGRVAQHPGVKLSVVRFLVDPSAEHASNRRRSRATIAELETEMKLDDECFAGFYERHVGGGHVAYVEKNLLNSSEAFSALKSLEGQYTLIIVGKGGGVNSALTVGMNDWEECPELGPIGDILSTSEFSLTASILIIQQHNPRGELDGLDDDFSIM